MKHFFRRLLGIYPNEEKKTLRFALLVVFWSLGATCISTLTDGLFIEKIGTSLLPKAYFIAALVMISASSLVLYLLKYFSPYQILMSLLIIGSIMYGIGAIILLHPPPVLFYFFCKVFSLAFLANLIACSWALIDNYHDIQDAKRTYALYNGCYFLGVIFSGCLISFLLKPLGDRFLFLLGAISLVAAMFQLKSIALKDRPIHDETLEGVFTGDRKGLFYLVKKIFSHPFVFSLLSISLIMQLTITTTEFNYLESFGNAFQNVSESKLTEFLAKTRALISVFNIIIGVFLYGRFVRLVGLRNIALLPALAFLLLYSKWLSVDSLMVAIFGLVCVDGISYTIEDNNHNLMLNAVPCKLKAKIRIINDSFFEPIGMLLSSAFLLSSSNKLIGLFLAVIMLTFACIIRATYHKSVFTNLKDNAVHFDRKIKHWFQLRTKKEQKELKKDLIDGLLSSDEKVSLLSCEALLRLKETAYLSHILNAASRFSTQGKISFLSLLKNSSFKKDPDVQQTLIKWTHSSNNQSLQSHLDLYFIGKKYFNAPFKTINDLLCSYEKDKIILGLEILSETMDSEHLDSVLSLIKHPCITVQRKAMSVFSKIADPKMKITTSYLLDCLEKVSDHSFRIKCLEALMSISDPSLIERLIEMSAYFRPSERRKIEELIVSMGKDTAPTLLSLLKDVSKHIRSRTLAGKILSRISLSTLQAHLNETIYVEIKRAYFYFYYANCIESKDLSLLVTGLKTGFYSVIDFVIHLLSISKSIEDCELLVRSLRSKNEKIHSHALESLERACHRKIFKWIAPLIDRHPWNEVVAGYVRLFGKKPTLNLPTLLDHLQNSPRLFDRVVAEDLRSVYDLSLFTEPKFELSNEPCNQFAYG